MARKTTTGTSRTTSTPAIEKKALAESNKSAGMRMLFEDGYTVAQVRVIFNAPYGYVYGVADRAGFADTAASRRAPRKATKAAKSAKATQAKVTANRSPKSTAKTPRVVAAATPRSRKAKAAPAVAAKPGRPSAARRAANRAPRTTVAKA